MKINTGLDNFELLVEQHYESLYRFALSLSSNPTDACDLTQQAFYVAQTKGHQLRDPSKVRNWLSTTLRRLFLQRRRHETRFPKLELDEAELPRVGADHITRLDSQAVLSALRSLEDHLRVPLVLFYMEDLSYKQIAAALDIPIGTVMSRLSRGKMLLRQRLEDGTHARCVRRKERWTRNRSSFAFAFST